MLIWTACRPQMFTQNCFQALLLKFTAVFGYSLGRCHLSRFLFFSFACICGKSLSFSLVDLYCDSIHFSAKGSPWHRANVWWITVLMGPVDRLPYEKDELTVQLQYFAFLLIKICCPLLITLMLPQHRHLPFRRNCFPGLQQPSYHCHNISVSLDAT